MTVEYLLRVSPPKYISYFFCCSGRITPETKLTAQVHTCVYGGDKKLQERIKESVTVDLQRETSQAAVYGSRGNNILRPQGGLGWTRGQVPPPQAPP